MIREMERNDLGQVMALEAACFKEPWTYDNLCYELNGNPFSHGWILECDGTIEAYAIMWETFETAQLARIGVHPSLRRRHKAEELLKALDQRALEAGCEVLSLEVRAGNEAAVALYEKNGFIQVNVSKKYYPDGEDALVMVKPIGGLE